MTPICCSESHYAAAITSGAGNSSSSGDRDYNICQGSYVVSKNEIVYHNFMMNDGGEENHFDSSNGKDVERDDSGTSRTEDFEVRMDLTDDLLHMVFVYLQFPLFQQLFPFLLLLQYIYFCLFTFLLSGFLFPGPH